MVPQCQGGNALSAQGQKYVTYDEQIRKEVEDDGNNEE